MKTSNKPILEQVNDIQEKLDEAFVKRKEAKIRDNYLIHLTYLQAGYYEEVKLVMDGVEIDIWDSEIKRGEWCEKVNEYESLESLFIKTLKDLNKNKIKGVLKDLQDD